MIEHKWVDADFGGTVGWFQCANCGHKMHVPSNEPPTSDLKVYDPICEAGRYYTGIMSSCEEIVTAKATRILSKLQKSNTPSILMKLRDLIARGFMSMKITINFDQLQTADNGDTTHYGGTITVNGEEIQAHGTDRDYNLQGSVQKKIESLINRELIDTEYEKFEDKFCDLENFEIELDNMEPWQTQLDEWLTFRMNERTSNPDITAEDREKCLYAPPPEIT